MAQEKKDEVNRPQREQPSNNTSTSDDSSMINRVQSSATGLLRNALAGTGAGDLNADLSNSVSSSEKATSSQGSRLGGSSLSTESSRPSNHATGTTGHGEHSLPSESFRSGVTAPEDDIEGTTYLGEAQANDLLYDLSDTKGKGTTTTTTSTEDTAPHHQPLTPSELSTFATAWNTQPQQQQDGSEVIALLSSPSFQPSTFPSDPDEDSPPSDLEQSLSPSEIQLIDSFRRHPSMPSPSTLHDPTPLNPLSLIPDPPSSSSSLQKDSDAEELRHLPGLSDWIDLDRNYHVEVWGYLRPHIRAAMDEIEERRNAAKKEKGEEGTNSTAKHDDGPAVRRLRMILKHMRAE